MTPDEENAIMNASAEDLMKKLTTGGKSVEAVVTVVLSGGGDFHINTRLDLSKPPVDEEEAARVEANVLLAVADLLDTYVHEHELCADCNSKKGTVQ
jgi:hypothetical protein